MKKPTDNTRHQLLKYLVDRANRTPSTTTAPPQYMTNPSTTLRIPVMYAPNTYSDEAYDNSITIIGDKNSVTTNPSKATDAEHDQQQMSNLAITVVNALKTHGLTQEGGCERPITIQLKRGVTIHGTENRFAAAYPGGSPNLANCADGDCSRSVLENSSVCFVYCCYKVQARLVYKVTNMQMLISMDLQDLLKAEDDVEETGQPPKKRARY
jgi:hypothetical protein